VISTRVATVFGLAVVASALAIYASLNPTVEVGGATAAIVMASVGGVLYYFERIPAAATPEPLDRPEPEIAELSARRIEAALRGGRLEREGLVLLLDSVERDVSGSDFPPVRADELRRVTQLSRSDFRSYVLARLDRLEGGA
jgi:hypothetical protein